MTGHKIFLVVATIFCTTACGGPSFSFDSRTVGDGALPHEDAGTVLEPDSGTGGAHAGAGGGSAAGGTGGVSVGGDAGAHAGGGGGDAQEPDSGAQGAAPGAGGSPEVGGAGGAVVVDPGVCGGLPCPASCGTSTCCLAEDNGFGVYVLAGCRCRHVGENGTPCFGP